MQTSQRRLGMINSTQKLKNTHALSKTKLNDMKIVRTHLIDGVYEGFVNASYQRDGFGIVQTDDFQTYMGYFKYNKPNGLGLIIYTDGSMIYANFHQGKLEGIGLTDNGIQIQIGTFKGACLTGMGYEYIYKTCKWKLNSYHKGVAIDVIKEETLALEDGVPNILTLESEILTLFLSFKKRSYFSKLQFNSYQSQPKQNINSFYVHELTEREYYFGAVLDSRYDGLGLVYNMQKREVSEVGMYRQGKLNGFGMKINSIVNSQELGFYIDGLLDGICFMKNGGRTKFAEFRKGLIIVEDKRGESLDSITKAQRIYYYRQKDFLSTRNGLNLDSFKVLFESSEFKAWKVQEQNDKKQKLDQIKSSDNKSKSKPSPKNHITTTAVLPAQQKTSIQIMKEKIFNMMTHKDGKRNEKSANLLFQKEIQDVDNTSYERKNLDDDIALEENPIQNLGIEFFPKKKSVSFRTQYNNDNQV